MTIIAPPPVETTTQTPLGEAVPVTGHRFSPSPLNRRRWQNFKSNRRGYWSFWIFLILFFVSLFAELIANDRPFLVKFDGHLYWPAFVTYSETTFGGDFETAADYRDPYLQKLIADKGGTIVWPLIRYSYDTHNLDLPTPAPSKPTWMLTEAQCKEVVQKKGLKSCRDLEYNWLGTDDQGRDVVARLIYGFRISVLFGLSLTIISSIIGVAAGGVQGYFGGWIDLGFQRFIEVWTAIPSLYLLLILSSVLVPGFFVLLGILLLFSWVSLVGLVRAEFLRGRNFEYIMAARALGVSNAVIMFRHLLPNAMVATMTFLPFIVSSSVMTLTALDFLGFGLPPGSPSLGELLSQAQGQRAGAVARLHRLLRGRDHAVAPDLHRRSGARRVRSAQDVQVGEPHGRHQPAPARRSRSVGGVPPAERHLDRGRPHFVRDQARRVRGAGRRIRLREIGQRAVDPEAAAVSDRVASFRQHPLQGARTARPVGARDPRHPRQRHFDHLPGADDLAQSAAHDRVPDRRDPASAQQHQRLNGAGADARTADRRSAFPNRKRGLRAIRINCPAASASG